MKLARWLKVKTKKTLGVFITTFTGAVVGTGAAGEAGIITVGDSGTTFGSPHLYLAALATAIGVALVTVAFPALIELGTNLESTKDETL